MDQIGMPDLSVANGTGRLRPGVHEIPDSLSGKKRNIHGGKQNGVAFIFQVGKTDLDRFKHRVSA